MDLRKVKLNEDLFKWNVVDCNLSFNQHLGTRFRPLSLDLPKPLFPLAGYPMIFHHIEAASKANNNIEVSVTKAVLLFY